MGKITAAIEKFLVGIVFTITAILVVLIFAQVVLRYMFSAGMVWAEEICTFLFIWDTFLGIAIGVRRGSHIGVDFLMSKLPKAKKPLVVLQTVLVCAFFGILLVQGSLFAIEGLSAVSAVLYIPLGYVYAVIPVASLFCIFFSAENLLEVWKGEKLA